MKSVYLLIAFFLSSPAWSGDESYDSQDYDQSTGLLIVPIMAVSEKRGFLSYENQISKNLFLYNTNKKHGRKAFDKYYGEITGYLLESAFAKEGDEIDYQGSSIHLVKNNQFPKVRLLNQQCLLRHSTRQKRPTRSGEWKNSQANPVHCLTIKNQRHGT